VLGQYQLRWRGASARSRTRTPRAHAAHRPHRDAW
jgi:hypothetical protein